MPSRPVTCTSIADNAPTPPGRAPKPMRVSTSRCGAIAVNAELSAGTDAADTDVESPRATNPTAATTASAVARTAPPTDVTRDRRPTSEQRANIVILYLRAITQLPRT